MKRNKLFFFTILIVLKLATQAQAETANICTENDSSRDAGALIPVPYASGMRFPSLESICLYSLRNALPPFDDSIFHSLEPVIEGGSSYHCRYRLPTSQDPSASFRRGLVGLACIFPTFAEDDYQNEDIGCDADNNNNSPHPCNVATGNKFRAEVDFNHPTLSFTRYYNSQVPASPRSLMGNHWSHSHQVRVSRSVGHRASYVTKTGRTESFTASNSIRTVFENRNNRVANVHRDNGYRLEVIEDSDAYYKIIHPSGTEEYFNALGQILFKDDPNGKRTTFKYEDFFGLSYLDTVTDHYGHSIKFDYELIPLDGFNSIDSYTAETSIDNDGGGTRTFLIETPYQRLSKVTDPYGAVYLYNYDDNHNLVEVIYPDTTSDDSDNPRKTYHYENENFPNHLTGITDENGERYANFAYDEGGRAVVSELGVTTNQVGQEKIELDYQGVD